VVDSVITSGCSFISQQVRIQIFIGLAVTAQAGTVIPGNNRRKIRVVRKELCYGKAETLEDAEEAARWWRYNLVKIKEWLVVL